MNQWITVLFSDENKAIPELIPNQKIAIPIPIPTFICQYLYSTNTWQNGYNTGIGIGIGIGIVIWYNT